MVQDLLDQAETYGSPEFLVADRAFDGYQVLATAMNRNLELLTPLRKNKYQKAHCWHMEIVDIDADVPSFILETTVEENGWDFDPDVVNELYVPSTRENVRTSVFRTYEPMDSGGHG